MALFGTKESTRLYLPSDLPGIAEGDWVEISSVYTGAMRHEARLRAVRGRVDSDDIDYLEYKQAILESVITGWSDPTPPTPEAIANLNPFVQDWIGNRFFDLAGRSEDEKKDLSESSSSGLPAEETTPSLVSSAT